MWPRGLWAQLDLDFLILLLGPVVSMWTLPPGGAGLMGGSVGSSDGQGLASPLGCLVHTPDKLPVPVNLFVID